MNNTFRKLAAVAFSAGTCLATFAAQAQYLPTADYYGQGIDAYFAGHSCQAESLLSTAIEFNSQDPRAYYFRAFSLLRQGRVDEARGDMLTGALLEAQQPHRFAIGSALERIQGYDRLMLEEFRRNARLEAAAVVTASASQPATSGPATTFAPTAPNAVIREGEANVLREQRVVPLEELLRPGGPNSVAVEPTPTPPALPPQHTQPAGKAAQQPAGGQPADAPVPAGNDPFADDSSEAAPPATPVPPTPPQETPPAAPQPTPPTTPPADPGENPFG